MREILFRGKRIGDGTWVEGYFFAKPILEKYFIIDGENQWMVDPKTVGQYTGKDFKGKRCFGGDIIFTRYSRLLVDWDNDFSAWMTYYFDDNALKRKFCPLYDIAIWETDGVIGNIHDNPELMEV